MKAKSLLLTSVVGAVAVGGALTGVTVASFTDSTPAPADTLRTGHLSLDVKDQPAMLDASTAEPAVGLVTITEASEGKNLETVHVVEDVSVSGLASASLEVSFRAAKNDNPKSCPKGEDAYSVWSPSSADSELRGLPVGGTGKTAKTSSVCVLVAPSDQAAGLLGAGAHQGRMTLRFASQQLRDEQPTGWRSSTTTAPIPVPVVITPAAPREVSCSLAGHKVETVELVLTWPHEPGVTDYRVHRVWKKKSELWPGTPTTADGRTTWRIRLADVITESDVQKFLDGDEDAGDTLSIEAGAGDNLWSEATLVSVEPAAAPKFVQCT